MSKATFCRRLEEGIKDEAKAAPWYGSLVNIALTAGIPEGDAGKIADIRLDEKEHHAALIRLRDKYCRVK